MEAELEFTPEEQERMKNSIRFIKAGLDSVGTIDEDAFISTLNACDGDVFRIGNTILSPIVSDAPNSATQCMSGVMLWNKGTVVMYSSIGIDSIDSVYDYRSEERDAVSDALLRIQKEVIPAEWRGIRSDANWYQNGLGVRPAYENCEIARTVMPGYLFKSDGTGYIGLINDIGGTDKIRGTHHITVFDIVGYLMFLTRNFPVAPELQDATNAIIGDTVTKLV